MELFDDYDDDDQHHPAEAAFERNNGMGAGAVAGGRHGGNGKGKGKGKGREDGTDIRISKNLSRLLRHQADAASLKLDSEGFARLDRVLNWGPLRSLNLSVSDIRRIVENCEKQRFTLKTDLSLVPQVDDESEDPSHFLIRANQGHTVKVDSEGMFTPIDATSIPPTVLHGTFFCFWAPIVESGGLKRQGRQHIHCATGTPEDNVVGMRRDAELVIEIDVAKSIHDGFKWWRSANGYALTEGDEEGMLPLKYFKEVRGRLRDVGLLVKDGEVVGSLPDGLKTHVPLGKGRRGGNKNGSGGRGGRRDR